MKQAAAAMLLLLLALVVVHHAAAAGGHRQAGHIWKKQAGAAAAADGGRPRSSTTTTTPMAGLTQCVTICGSGVTTCMLGCYPPLIDLDPVELPVCLLNCTNDALVCASGCPVSGNV